MDLFSKRGWELLINDDLVGNSLMVGSIGVGVCTSVFAYLCGFLFVDSVADSLHSNDKAPYFVLAVLGFLIGTSTGLLLSTMIVSAVKSIFVYFAEDPLALRVNHNEEYDELLHTWQQIHPASVTWLLGSNDNFIGSSSGRERGSEGSYVQPENNNNNPVVKPSSVVMATELTGSNSTSLHKYGHY
jgi:hypothetical protein